MYTPPAFAVGDVDWAIELIGAYPFGLLIVVADGSPQITHLPMLAELRGGELWVVGHVSKGNPHARSIVRGARATLVFQGPHAYVSASWYEEPYQTVPTWNYTAVHCDGRLQEADGYRTLAVLNGKFEEGRERPWEMERLELDYLENQLEGIVAFEMRVDALRAKAKLSQNRTPADRDRVATALETSLHEFERDCAAAMRRA